MAWPPGWTSRIALAALVAPGGFFLVMMLLGFVTPGYNWVARYASELSLGSLGWIMIANFIALGVTELALAAVLGRTLGDHASERVATAAVGLLGAAFVGAGACVTDPAKLVTGARPNAAALTDINAALTRVPLVLEFGAGGLPLLRPGSDGAGAAIAALAATVAATAARGSWHRLRMCAASDSSWVFYDTSRRGGGRWCSMAVCGNRAKTRRYRQRQAQAPAG